MSHIEIEARHHVERAFLVRSLFYYTVLRTTIIESGRFFG
jgi:hypothetical protein